MVSSYTEYLMVEMPSGIAPSGGTNTLRLPIVADSAIRGGKRAIERTLLDDNASSPGRRRRVEWAIHGPVGASLESSAQYLGVDVVQDMETRWFQRLVPAIGETALGLTGFDPPGVDGSYFGSSYFGSAYFGGPVGGGGGSSGAGPDVVVFAEQDSYILVMRGQLLTQVDPTTDPWTVVSTTVLNSAALDADHWRGTVKIAEGPSGAMQRVVGVSVSGPLLEDVVATTPAETVFAYATKRGSDRAWYINANESQSTFNFAGFTLDDFENLAAPFQVGDPDSGSNGIGPFGPLTYFGFIDNFYSFTDQGKPVPLSRALYSHHSMLNGKQWADPGFGWNYALSQIGMRALSSGSIDNPVGIGETMRQFTGHNGIPTAVYSERGELWACYQTTSGQLYAYRCAFGPETAGTGQPLLFPWAYQSGAYCGAIFSSVTGAADQGTWVMRGDGTNLRYSLIADDGRDDLYPSYEYNTGTGIAYLTTLNRDVNLLKTLRLVRLRTRNFGAGSSAAVAFAFDASPTAPTSATYTTIGTVTSNGQQTLTPISGSAPIASISGYTMKPRITLSNGAAAGATTPAELDGTLEVEYDERPQQVEQIAVTVYLTGQGLDENYVWSALQSLKGSAANGPFLIQIPDNLPPGVTTAAGGGKYYAMLSDVQRRQDMTKDDVEAVVTVWDCWPQASAV